MANLNLLSALSKINVPFVGGVDAWLVGATLLVGVVLTAWMLKRLFKHTPNAQQPLPAATLPFSATITHAEIEKIKAELREKINAENQPKPL